MSCFPTFGNKKQPASALCTGMASFLQQGCLSQITGLEVTRLLGEQFVKIPRATLIQQMHGLPGGVHLLSSNTFSFAQRKGQKAAHGEDLTSSALLLGPSFSPLHCSLNITSTQVVAVFSLDLCFHQRALRQQAKPRAKHCARLRETKQLAKRQGTMDGERLRLSLSRLLKGLVLPLTGV